MISFPMSFRRSAKALFRGVLSVINSHPKLRRYALAVIYRLGLYGIARRLYARIAGTSIRGQYSFIATDHAHLTPRARQIYADLKAAIAQHKKENA